MFDLHTQELTPGREFSVVSVYNTVDRLAVEDAEEKRKSLLSTYQVNLQSHSYLLEGLERLYWSADLTTVFFDGCDEENFGIIAEDLTAHNKYVFISAQGDLRPLFSGEPLTVVAAIDQRRVLINRGTSVYLYCRIPVPGNFSPQGQHLNTTH